MPTRLIIIQHLLQRVVKFLVPEMFRSVPSNTHRSSSEAAQDIPLDMLHDAVGQV